MGKEWCWRSLLVYLTVSAVTALMGTLLIVNARLWNGKTGVSSRFWLATGMCSLLVGWAALAHRLNGVWMCMHERSVFLCDWKTISDLLNGSDPGFWLAERTRWSLVIGCLPLKRPEVGAGIPCWNARGWRQSRSEQIQPAIVKKHLKVA